MKKTLILILPFIFTFSFSQINLDSIKRNVTENPQENYYPLLAKFKSNPDELSQTELNQVYYGSKYLKSEYSISDFNSDYKKIWKPSSKKLSKSKAIKIVQEAQIKYFKNPLMDEILQSMTNIYTALDENLKATICSKQIELISNTIYKSGDGKTENTAICVIRPGDVVRRIGFGSDYKSKTLVDGSSLTTYELNGEKNYIILVGGYY